MSDKEDPKYTSEEDRNSQVRNIINQLNADKPSREKSREVVVRADGTKVVRVVKKRKIMMTRDEKYKRARKNFVYVLLGVLMVLGVLTGVVAYRFSQMSSQDYYDKLAVEIGRGLGAERIQLNGAELRGLVLNIANVVADFPEGSMVQRLEMSNINCELDSTSFFSGKLKSEEVKIERAKMVVPATVEKIAVPTWQGEDVWFVKRMFCKDFTCVYGSDESSPVSVLHSEAYLYYPTTSGKVRILSLKGGTFRMKAWRPLEILDAKVQVSSGLENIKMRMTADVSREKGKEPSSYVEISGHLQDGASLSSALYLESSGMDFADFTSGRFSRVLAARTAAVPGRKLNTETTVVLPFASENPIFNGSFLLNDIKIATLPALLGIMEHIEPTKREDYLPLKLDRGRLTLKRNGEDMQISFAEEDFNKIDLIRMSGDISVNASNEISGTITYGIPSLLTYVEYPDGNSDPIFRDDGSTAWVTTTLSGMANSPTDNIEELESLADVARRDRPQRTPFANIDVDSIAESVLGDTPSADNANDADNPVNMDSAQPQESKPANNSGNPFEKKSQNPFENPFEEKSNNPFSSGGSNFGSGDFLSEPSKSGDNLSMPVDNSIFSTGQ